MPIFYGDHPTNLPSPNPSTASFNGFVTATNGFQVRGVKVVGERQPYIIPLSNNGSTFFEQEIAALVNVMHQAMIVHGLVERYPPPPSP